MNNKYITQINALRGFAAIAIVFHHAASMLHNRLNIQLPFESFFIDKAYLAVDLFFILSGFIMMHVYQHKFATISVSQYLSFIKNRFARVYPIYFTVLAMMGLGYYLFDQVLLKGAISSMPAFHNSHYELSGFSFLTNLLMIQSWHLHEKFSWNMPAWSVSCEWFVYLLAPFLIQQFMKMKGLIKPVIMFIVCLVLLTQMPQYLFQTSGLSFMTVSYGNLRIVYEFSMGLCTYLIYRSLDNGPSRVFYDICFLLVSILLLAVLSGTAEEHYGLTVSLFSLLILFCALSSSHISRFLSAKLLFYLGEISYSLYIIHFVLLGGLSLLLKKFIHVDTLSTPEYVLYLAFSAVLCAVAAHFAYQYIEIPGRKLLRNGSGLKLPFLASPSQLPRNNEGSVS
ncbi:MAG: acyltransferase [Vampirovibrio sp.]|jgi:peptidoglycan/LPS O-acetylase OafA/YrhL|nr:acyltransferase [Vampirovibrio sp.]